VLIYHDGKVASLAPSNGGYGIMSGLVSDGAFYYTYSWGSGIHRSHVARLEIKDGKLISSDTGGFKDLDLFVSDAPDGKVRIKSGKFESFNHYRDPKEFGIITSDSSSKLKILDSKGNSLPPTARMKRRAIDQGFVGEESSPSNRHFRLA
jgi:hypothetical protein